jgi:hypothetical protein
VSEGKYQSFWKAPVAGPCGAEWTVIKRRDAEAVARGCPCYQRTCSESATGTGRRAVALAGADLTRVRISVRYGSMAGRVRVRVRVRGGCGVEMRGRPGWSCV